MTPARLRDCLTVLGLNQRELARILEIERCNVQRWESGRLPIPQEVADWLEALVPVYRKTAILRNAALLANPPPILKLGRWRKEKACITRQLGA